MLTKRINKWLVSVRKYLFFYRDGYYELPYISNSPDIMVASFQNMPFTKHNAERQTIHANNPFTDGVMYYRELEEGFWLMLTDIEFKKNISTKALYDGEPCDYYFLSHFRYTSVVEHTVINKVRVPTAGWGLYKPGTDVTTYLSAGAKGVFVDFAFNTAWFEKNMQSNRLPENHRISQYLASDEAHLSWADIVPVAAADVEKLVHCLKDETPDAFNEITIKMLCYNLVSGFFKKVDQATATPFASMKESDRRHMAKAEHMIIAGLTSGFPGIETVAKAVHMSPTKLKALFKEMYGNTMFQYYQEKQMLLALELLHDEDNSVKYVADLLGYDHPSNFSNAFKKYHGFLPSGLSANSTGNI